MSARTITVLLALVAVSCGEKAKQPTTSPPQPTMQPPGGDEPGRIGARDVVSAGQPQQTVDGKVPTAFGKEVDPPDCVEVRKETPWHQLGGYHQIAHVTNVCERLVICDLNTDRHNPKQRFELGAGASDKVITRQDVKEDDLEFEVFLDCWYRQ